MTHGGNRLRLIPEARFDYRMTVGVYGVTAAGIAPFAAYHFARQEWYMGVTAGGLTLAMVVGGIYVYSRRGQTEAGALAAIGMLVANLAVVMSLYRLGAVGIYWYYPLILANFFMLTQGAALIANFVLLASAVLFLHNAVPLGHFVRICSTLPLAALFAFIFSSSVNRQQKALARLATLDTLTGTGNRRGLEEALQRALYRQGRYKEAISLILIDFDHFKEINDSHGHAVGDSVLVEFVEWMRRRIRQGDGLFRYGGDEFVVLLPHTSQEQGLHLAEELRLGVEDRAFGPGIGLRISAGVAELLLGEATTDWLKRSDQALYQAKQQRNCVHPAEAGTVSRNAGLG